MPAAYTGFGSGPYNTLLYDRSWVTAFVTLGVSTSDAYTSKLNSYARLTLGSGFTYENSTSFISNNRLTFDSQLSQEQTSYNAFNTSISLGVSVADSVTAIHEINDTVTLGVSTSDSYTSKLTSNVRVTLGTVVEALKVADGYYYTSFALGVGTAIPTVSPQIFYAADLALGGLVVDDQITGGASFTSNLTFNVSLAEQQTTKYEVYDTVTLGVSVADITSAQAIFNTPLILGADFVYNNTASFVFNNLLTFATQITAEVSSTGRYLDQWSSVTAAASETWTTVAAGAAETWVSVGGVTPETWTTVSLGFD